MRWRAKRAVAVTLGALAFGAALAFPSPLGAGLRPAAEASCLTPTCDRAVEAIVDRVDDYLASRMSEAGSPERRELAKAIVAESSAAGIDPILVLAVIDVESSWDPAALSRRGARGLMQLLEPTMRQEMARSGLEYDDPHDPVANVRAGIRYLKRLLDAFGREDLALMAYNAGPNRLLGLIREGAIPERFRAYPRRVLAERRRLRRTVGDADTPLVAEVIRPERPL